MWHIFYIDLLPYFLCYVFLHKNESSVSRGLISLICLYLSPLRVNILKCMIPYFLFVAIYIKYMISVYCCFVTCFFHSTIYCQYHFILVAKTSKIYYPKATTWDNVREGAGNGGRAGHVLRCLERARR